MQRTFSNFLTIDDEKAARHSVLVEDTAYYQSSILFGADGCESRRDIARLNQLGNNFTFPDSLKKLQEVNRSSFVKQRGSLLISALLASNSDKISSIVADPTKFILSISSDATDVFPNLPQNQSQNSDGTSAISTLANAGPFRSGCWQALPTQNLRNMVGAVLNNEDQ
jgi:hypothetical protein